MSKTKNNEEIEEVIETEVLNEASNDVPDYDEHKENEIFFNRPRSGNQTFKIPAC